MPKVIITGGPCVGKTTVLESLCNEGYTTLSESAREIIEVELKKSKGILPWTNFRSFQKKVADFQIHKERGSIVNFVVHTDSSFSFCSLILYYSQTMPKQAM